MIADAPRKGDTIIAADFSRQGDLAVRLAEEVRHLVRQQQRVLLLQVRPVAAVDRIQPAIQACIERGDAEILPRTDVVEAKRIVIHEPSRAIPSALKNALAGRRDVHMVCHCADDLYADPIGGSFGGVLRRYVTREDLRACARDASSLEADLWLPPPPSISRRTAGRRRTTLAWFGECPTPVGLPDVDQVAVRNAGKVKFVRDERITDISQFSLDRLTTAVDVFVAADPADTPPDTLIAAVLATGRRVVLHDSHRAHFGAGPSYFGSDDPIPAIFEALRDIDAGGGTRPAPDFPRRCEKAPITRIGDRGVRRAAVQTSPRIRPALYVPSNGVGVGHLTRLLAIARRTELPGVFASQVAAPGLIEKFGFSASYIPSAAWVGGNFEDWDTWFNAHIERAIEEHDPSVVVYDGNHCTRGLIEAVTARPDCRLVWVRRGMWGDSYSDDLANARWCDLVIEPGELAAERDTGITSTLRETTHQVAPIRLFDETELLGREEAARDIGLDPTQPAVLIQLGSGQNRDLVSILDTIIGHLRMFDGLQIAVTEWLNGTAPLNLWPDVTVLRGYPLSQYLRAFDFSISAAGYNSFHELIAYQVPTVFIANNQPGMDDQQARARFAQDKGAAFEVSVSELEELPEVLEMLMHEEARGYLAERCRQFGAENGSLAAANEITRLI